MSKAFNDELMFLTANGFHDTFQTIYNNTIQQLDESEIFSKKIHYFDVATVNAAFACEIYLKFLLMYEPTNSSVPCLHNLLELFNSLSDTTKNKIMEHLSSKYSKQSFLDALTIISNDFRSFRYSYENPTNPIILNFDFYNDLLETLRTICETKKTRA